MSLPDAPPLDAAGTDAEERHGGRSRRARAALWGATVAWAALIWVASSLPAVPSLPVTFPHIDKLGHGLIFAVLGALLAAAIRPGPWSRAVLAVCLGVAWGAIDELHQAFVPGRTSSWGDLLADCAGASLGVALVALWRRRAALRRVTSAG